jgi:hypothetical protein
MATGVHLLAALLLGYPALGGQLLLNPRSDQFIAGYAFRDFARQHFVEHGSIPQWNPYLFGGLPFVDAMHGDTFYPTALLRLLLGTGSGMTWGLILHIFLAGCFTYLFLRSLRLSFPAAMVGGVAYQMGGNVAGLVSPGHDGKLFVATLLPLALYFVVRGIRDGKAWAWGPLALVVGGGVLSPHPQLLQYMLLVTGALALFLARGLGSEPGEPGVRGGAGWRRFAASMGAIAVGMMIGAIQYYPVTKYTPFSPRAGGTGYEFATSFSMPPEEVLNFALPQFSGILDNYWGRNAIHFHSEYIGVSVLVLAALAFGRWNASAQRRWTWFFAGTFVVALLWALGEHTPFYRLVYALVPGTKFFRAPSTMLYVVSFATAVLAAFGAERVLGGTPRTRTLVGAALVVLVLGLLGVSGLLTNTALSLALPQMADRVLPNEPALQAGALRMVMFGLLTLAALYLTGARRLSRDLAGAFLVAVVAADLWSVLRAYFQWAPPARELYASDAAIDYLQQQPGPFRVATLGPTKGNGRDVNLRYDGLMSAGIPIVQGYQGNHIARYDLLTGEGTPPPQLGNPNFWRLGNVRYFLTDLDPFPLDSARKVIGPVTNAAGNQVFVYELPVETAYAWVTPAIASRDDATAAEAILDPRFDVRRAAVFAPESGVTESQAGALPEPLAIKTGVRSWRPGYARIELDQPAPAGSALVVSENFYPGWQARVDGASVAVHRANVSLIGIALPAGARSIDLEFVNGPYRTGRLVTWLAIVASLLWWLVGWRRRPEVHST